MPAPHTEGQRRFTRLATAFGKYWITKRAIAVVAEALECLGGNGYVEESSLPRLYRDAPLNSIWEGSGNVQCLEMLRTVKKDAGTLEMVLQEIRAARRGNKHFDSFADRLERELADSTQLEARARCLAEPDSSGLWPCKAHFWFDTPRLKWPTPVCASRLCGDAGLVFGTLPADTDFDVIIERSRPRI